TSTRQHDPGIEAAAERAANSAERRAGPFTLGGAEVRIGTAGWTDPLLTRAGAFYPPGTSSAEERLRYYSSRFAFAEVDATYYALPARQTAELWVERTPDDFVFDIKAHALMTGHPTETKRLPKELRDALPKDLAAKARLYATDLPPELMERVWELFKDALAPLDSAGKLGAVLLQFPPWFGPSRENAASLLATRDALRPLAVSVEFRNPAWFEGRTGDRTVEWLTEHQVPLVISDTPPGTPQSVPRRAAVTTPSLSIFRLHGRRSETWAKKGASVAERFRYLYDEKELQEVIPDIADAGREAKRMHIVFNNCYGNYGTTNAMELFALFWERLKVEDADSGS
ncbi:MAG TPA: DUF72 domain-containing protein, partial [Gemmatimonadales bacterium]|nr:DUF72 domain-containing protein [Gemmatimonadales bacterium]